MKRTLTAVAVLLVLGLSARAQQPSPPTGSISGQVVLDGKPVAGIGVLVSTRQDFGDAKTVARTSTDKEGNFTFSDLAAGNYTLLPDAPAYVINGQKRSWNPGMSVTLAAGETVDALSLVLERGGVITGRVYDSNGKPVIEENVQIRPVDENGKPVQTSFSFSSNRTDDRGIYRVFGLKPGRYIVSAGMRSDGGQMNYGTARKQFPETFYPGVMDEGRATPVEVTTGGEVSGIDIGFGRLTQTFTVSGRVLDESGAPVAKVNCGYGMVTGGRFSGGIGFGGTSNDRGEFEFNGLGPGSYAAIVWPDGKNPRYASPTPFEVADRNVSGLVINMKKGTTVSGSVVFEGAAARESASAAQNVAVVLSRPPSGSNGSLENQLSAKSGRLNADGSFTLAGVAAGQYQIGIWSYGGAKGMSVVRIERNGTPIPSEIEVTAETDVTGLVIVVASGTGALRGHVTVTGGTLPNDHMSVAYRRADVSTQAQRARIDDRGQFLVEGLAAGEYIASIDGYTGDTPGNWVVHKGKEQHITVADGATADVSLTLDLEHDPTEKP